MNPNSVPGSVTGIPSLFTCGVVVETYCLACTAVESSSSRAWMMRRSSTAATPSRRIATTPTAAYFASLTMRGGCISGWISDMAGRSFGALAVGETPVDTGEHHRHE